MTLDDDGGEEDELFYAEKEHLWEKKELKVHFINPMLTCPKKNGHPLTAADVIEIANDWHRSGTQAGRDVVPKFVLFTGEEGSDIRVQYIGKGHILLA